MHSFIVAPKLSRSTLQISAAKYSFGPCSSKTPDRFSGLVPSDSSQHESIVSPHGQCTRRNAHRKQQLPSSYAAPIVNWCLIELAKLSSYTSRRETDRPSAGAHQTCNLWTPITERLGVLFKRPSTVNTHPRRRVFLCCQSPAIV